MTVKNNFELSPAIIKQIKKTGDINTSTVHVFLKILSEVPDTFIIRKVGETKAESVSSDSKKILKEGGLTTQSGRNLLNKLDGKLRDKNHHLSPGTTADLTEAVLALNNLNGYKP